MCDDFSPLTEEQLKSVQDAADLINNAEQPILYVGQGVIQSESSELLREISRVGNIPCTTTLLVCEMCEEVSR